MNISEIIFLNVNITDLLNFISFFLAIYGVWAKLRKDLKKIKWKKVKTVIIKAIIYFSIIYTLISPFVFLHLYQGEIDKTFMFRLSIRLFYASISFSMLLALIYLNAKNKRQKDITEAKYKETIEFFENLKLKNKETTDKIQKQQDELLKLIDELKNK